MSVLIKLSTPPTWLFTLSLALVVSRRTASKGTGSDAANNERKKSDSLEDAAHDHHLAEPRLDGQSSQDASERRQLVVRVQGVQL